MQDLTNDKINIDKNWEKLLFELNSTKKPGMDSFIEFIEKRTDFKNAPASTKFHMCFKGGLVEHTLNVMRFGLELQKSLNVPDITEENLKLVCLLHDLCKVNYYTEGKEWDKEWKNQTNQWREIPVWKVDDEIPLGHGEKSVILAVRYLPLSVPEMTAIRWHMGFSDQGVHSYYPSGAPFRASMDKYPLLKLLMLADAQAELYESYAYEE